MVNWGNAYMKVLTATVDDPETGEIITARINLTNGLLDEWMLKYLVQCGTARSPHHKRYQRQRDCNSDHTMESDAGHGRSIGPEGESAGKYPLYSRTAAKCIVPPGEWHQWVCLWTSLVSITWRNLLTGSRVEELIH